MGPDSIFRNSENRPPLDTSLYSLNEDESIFLKQQTGITDDEQLKQHVIAVQKKAYEVAFSPS
jgi:hypothetical protein